MLLAMNTLNALFALVDAYCGHVGIAEATLSSQLFSDGKRLKALRVGKDVGARRLERAIRWLDEHWPDGCEWPEGVMRPLTPERFDAMFENLEGAISE